MPKTAQAQRFPDVPRHDLQCGDVFPCPEEIRRRVDFWVMVFREWDTGQRVLHDSARPERVYTVLRTDGRCSSKKPGPAVAKEKRRIVAELRSLANGIASGRGPNGPYQRELIKHFNPATPKALRAAAKTVRCQSGNRDRYRDALKRFGAYRPMVLEALAQANLSSDIQYLPFVESAYNPRAYSHVGAAGVWQIMPSTARVLGLQINSAVDERFDPELATVAAAKYLRNSTDRLKRTARDVGIQASDKQINPFVITSYNYGVAGMQKAIRQVGVDYVKLLDEYRSRTFRTAVRNFYASFLAARYVAQNSEKYFGRVASSAPPQLTRVSLQAATSIKRVSDVFKISSKELKSLNPSLTSRVWKGQRLIPAGYVLRLPPHAGGWTKQIARLGAMPAEGPADGGYRHVVLRGDTACGVAKEYGVRCRDLIELNRLDRRATIRIGQKLKIPSRVTTSVARASSPRGAIRASSTEHTVRRGQTPCGIAGRYRVKCSDLLAVNRLSWRDKIYVGQRLKIPGAAAGAASVHTVVRGQTPCGIAKRYRVDCNDLLAVNGLSRRSKIYVGQRLTVPGVGAGVAAAAKPVPALAGTPQPKPVQTKPATVTAADTEDELLKPLYATEGILIRIDRSKAPSQYSVTVLPEETLGHYADWLGIGGASQLRRLNGLRRNRALPVGRRIVLPVRSDVQLANFEESRAEFHRVLVEEYTQRYIISGVEQYGVRRGDTMWAISQEFQIPLWVLYRYNPGVKIAQTGDKILIPIVKRRA